MLSERAEKIKELNKATKEGIQQEEFRIRAVQEANKRIEEQIEALRRRQQLWTVKHEEEIQKLKTALEELQKIDIDTEIASHKDHKTWEQKRKDFNDLATQISRTKLDLDREQKSIKKLEGELAQLESHTCHTCGQEFHDSKHQLVLESKQKDLATAREASQEHGGLLAEMEIAHKSLGTLGKPPKMFYDHEEDAIHHRSSLATLQKQLEDKQNEIDPYGEQIEDMTGQALQTVSYDTLNDLTRTQEHQDFLLKLLTSKDSFIRKKIIEQNLSYLNQRLTHYLDRIGLPHTVVFQNDLSVSIEELGRELDFDNLSRGERNRLILSMSWAFRDVFESLYQPINVLFIDEMIDSGLDTQGVENSLALLKHMSRERHKSIWLVSHRDELAGRVENILRVVKENGFTSYNTDVEIA
jgi:DNA repair exonuclease SbcCD ATPase subunit